LPRLLTRRVKRADRRFEHLPGERAARRAKACRDNTGEIDQCQ